MAKTKESVGFLANLVEPALYKRSQGRLTRQLTGAVIGLVFFLGAWTLSKGPLSASYGDRPWISIGIPVALAAIGAWCVYRIVNYPVFADFLISVEAEMDKVTWASKQTLYRSTLVVVGFMFFLGFTLFIYDMFWQWFFQLIHFIDLDPVATSGK